MSLKWVAIVLVLAAVGARADAVHCVEYVVWLGQTGARVIDFRNWKGDPTLGQAVALVAADVGSAAFSIKNRTAAWVSLSNVGAGSVSIKNVGEATVSASGIGAFSVSMKDVGIATVAVADAGAVSISIKNFPVFHVSPGLVVVVPVSVDSLTQDQIHASLARWSHEGELRGAQAQIAFRKLRGENLVLVRWGSAVNFSWHVRRLDNFFSAPVGEWWSGLESRFLSELIEKISRAGE